MTDRSPWPRLLAIAALLAAFTFTARGGLRGAQTGNPFATSCEVDPPRDAARLERCLALYPRDIELMLDLGSLHEADRRADRAETLYRLATVTAIARAANAIFFLMTSAYCVLSLSTATRSTTRRSASPTRSCATMARKARRSIGTCARTQG